MAKKYIDAELLRNEIEKRKNICNGVYERDSDTYYQGKAVAYQETLSLIDSLQQEQPCEDFENEYEKFRLAGPDDDINDNYTFPIDLAEYKDFARHFYELGKQSKK